MSAILLILAARARRYWRSWLLLGLIAAVGTGVVLSAVTAGRRADSAFPRFAASHGYDAIVYSSQPLPKLATLREVSQVTPIRAPFYGQPRCSCGRQINQGDLAVREVPAVALGRMVKLVSGRLPDQASVHETLASFTLQRDYGISPGTVIRLPMAAASQWGAVLKAMAGGPVPKAAGPTIALRVVGIAAAESAAVGMLRTLIVALTRVAGGVVLATLLSAFAPVGEARLADPAPGLTFDWPVAVLGAVVAVAVVLVLGVAPALRGARTSGSARVVSAARSAPFRVVGLVSFPSDFGTGGLGTGAALTTAGYTAAQCPPLPAQPKCRRAAAAHPPDLVLVHAVPGPAGNAALARHIRQYPGDAARPTVPTALVNFGESADFPLLLAGVVTLFGAASLAHLLAVSVWRRRRDSGLLKALGSSAARSRPWCSGRP